MDRTTPYHRLLAALALVALVLIGTSWNCFPGGKSVATNIAQSVQASQETEDEGQPQEYRFEQAVIASISTVGFSVPVLASVYLPFVSLPILVSESLPFFQEIDEALAAYYKIIFRHYISPQAP
jgi:hypothetical protein